MAKSILVVDGTNVSWAWPKSRQHMLRRAYGSAQTLLVRSLLDSALRTRHQELLIVFDGPPSPGGPCSSSGALVLHPDIGRSADDRILELIGQRRHTGTAIALASSDRALRDAARTLGATTMGAMELLARLDGSASRPALESGPGLTGHEKPAPSSRDTEAWLQQFNARSARRSTGRPQKEGDSR